MCLITNLPWSVQNTSLEMPNIYTWMYKVYACDTNTLVIQFPFKNINKTTNFTETLFTCTLYILISVYNNFWKCNYYARSHSGFPPKLSKQFQGLFQVKSFFHKTLGKYSIDWASFDFYTNQVNSCHCPGGILDCLSVCSAQFLKYKKNTYKYIPMLKF